MVEGETEALWGRKQEQEVHRESWLGKQRCGEVENGMGRWMGGKRRGQESSAGECW